MKHIFPIIVLIMNIVFVNINETACYTNNIEQKNWDDFDLQALIEKIVKDLKNKLPEVFIFSDLDMFVPENKLLWGHINLNNISFSGLKEFNATILYRPLIAIPKGYIITLEQLNWNMDYMSNITLFNTRYLSIFGEGSTKITLKNLKFDGNVSISLKPVDASITVDIDLESTTFNISGLLGDENFSKTFGRLMEESVNNIFQISKKRLSHFLTYVVNYVIRMVLPIHIPPQLNLNNSENVPESF